MALTLDQVIKTESLMMRVIHSRSEMRKVLSLLLSVTFCLCMKYLVDRFVPDLHGRRVWSLARTSLNVKVKGHLGKTAFFSPFGGLRAVCLVKHL